jgi:molecular chaperone GrpE
MIQEDPHVENHNSVDIKQGEASDPNRTGENMAANLEMTSPSEEQPEANPMAVKLNSSEENPENLGLEPADIGTDIADSASEGDAEEETEESWEEALSQLAQEAESLRSQLDDRTSQYVRLVADFDNFRKRTQKEKEDLDQQVKRQTLGELLPVVDSFERARAHLKPQTEAEADVHKSYQGIYKQLVDCLKRIGVSPMRSEGKPFDPSLHEAVMREPTDQHPEGTVLEEMVRGYLLGERVLRHALVKVAASPEAVVASDENFQD